MNTQARTALYYAVVISLGGFVFGFDASVISGVLGFIEKEFDLGPADVGIIFAWTGIGAMLSSLTVGALSDAFGRKRVLQFLAILYAISAYFSAIAWNYEVLVIARAIGGYAFGSLYIAPIYIAELAPAKLRGRLGAVNQLNIVVGLSAAYFVNLIFLRMSTGTDFGDMLGITEANAWNWMLGFELLPIAIWFVLLLFMPRSPRWLAANGRADEARKVMARVASPDELESALSGIRDNLGGDKATLMQQISAIFTRKMAFIVFVSIIIAIIQMITGINAVFYYATTIFELSGVGQDAAFVQAVAVGLTNVVFTLIAMALIDRLGRKPLMLAGLAGAAISLGVVAYGFQQATYKLEPAAVSIVDPDGTYPELSALGGVQYDNDVAFKTAFAAATSDNFMRDNEAVILKNAMNANSRMILAGILGFVASFAISLGPIMWVFLSEIFPVRIRGLAISLVTIFNSGTSTAVTTFFPIQVANAGIASAFFIFCGWAVVGLVLLIFLMPETKGMSLEEIERKYVQSKDK